MNEVRVCENCKHHNPIDNLECEKCGFDLSFCIPVSEDNLIQKKCLRSLSDGEKIVLKEETLIGRDGVKEIVELSLTDEEKERFQNSRKVLEDNFNGLEL